MRPVPRFAAAALSVVALGGVLLVVPSLTGSPDTSDVAASAPVVPGSSLVALQARLRTQPRDVAAWASLGLAYVEQARVTGDATFYSKAEEACAEGTRLAPRDARVLTARAALAAARHDFTDALRLADEALVIAPDNASTTAVRADALTELGRYDDALDAARTADDLRPSLSTFARLSYAYELRGDLARATQLMTRAADAATTREDTSFARTLLGDLARRQGKRSIAAQQYAIALKASPGHLPALAGQAQLLAAGGQPAQAITAYEAIVARAPLPEHLVALGELYAANGRAADAQAQYDIVRATTSLAQANGVTTDLEAALFEADHGDSAAAVRMAQAEWARRQSIHVADALAWALHAAGRNSEALGYARRATSLGTKDAHLLYHRGAIEASAGLSADARKHLRAALAVDPHFSPFSAPRARALLASLESTS